MGEFYNGIPRRTRGAWIVHHAQKTAATINGAAEFPALDTAGKASSLLSQFAATDQTTLKSDKVQALAKAAGLNPKIELPSLLNLLLQKRLIDRSASGDIEVLGLTTAATVQHAAEIFDDQEPTAEEQASIALAELTSGAPTKAKQTHDFLSDEFKLSRASTTHLLARSEAIGFVDAEGPTDAKLYFNGNLFRRENLDKVTRVLGSLTASEQERAARLDATLTTVGCIKVEDAEAILGLSLFEKLKAAGMYDVNHVANTMGEHGFVTKPAAFHKFNDPVADDAFDLAKALVAGLTFGMTQSDSGRGRIAMIDTLLRRLIAGQTVGPATAIGEDYRVLEVKGVLDVRKASKYGFLMKLRKRDIGQMALAVLTTGETASTNSIDRPLPDRMIGYTGPEKTRSDFRQKQAPASKKLTFDVLDVLRTEGL